MNAESKPEIGDKMDSFILKMSPYLREKVVRNGLDRILYSTRYEFPQNYRKKIQDAALNGATFLVLANHASQADIPPVAYVCADLALSANQVLPLEYSIPGFVLPISATVESGKQGHLLQTLYEDIRPTLDRFGIQRVSTVTKNDQKERHEQENRVEFTTQMRNAAKERKSILLFPEGSVEGGRPDEKGKIKGIQKLQRGSIHLALTIQSYTNDRVFVLPVGVSGGYRVYDPMEKRLTLDAKTVGLGLSFQHLMTINVGEPIILTKSEIKSIDADLLDLEMAKRIANLLPAEERGVYA